MKVIFLDFDGVLNSERNLQRNIRLELPTDDEYGTLFDPDCVHCLRQIVHRTGAHVVLITSWKAFGEEPLRRLWAGRKMPGHMIGITPNDVPPPTVECDEEGMLPEDFDLSSLRGKGRAIEVWMEQNGTPEQYVIIDDWPDFTPAQQPHYLRTDPYVGLTPLDALRAIEILMQSENR